MLLGLRNVKEVVVGIAAAAVALLERRVVVAFVSPLRTSRREAEDAIVAALSDVGVRATACRNGGAIVEIIDMV